MKKTRYEDFVRQLLATGGYETAPECRRAVPMKPGAWASFRYFCCIMRMVCSCSAKNVFGLFTHDVWARATWRSLMVGERMGSTVTVGNFANRAAYKGPVIYVANHNSTLETMALPPILMPYGKIAIILKKALDEMPFVGKAVRAVGSIAVTRTNPREDLKTVLEEGCKRTRDGLSVLMFPQGTRQEVFHARKFSSLGAKLAERAGVPLVPIACQTDFLHKGKPGLFEDFGAVTPSKPLRFACGPLLKPELGSRAMQEAAVKFIEDKLREWGLPVE